ncbi:3-oxoacyl-[acyl-carrier-protein] synthase-3 [Streptomyces sp. yr375]|uniref:3-oxoacyl-ACP synthase III family protein n=1 Tax=Streptomyces sp. yr375 TaxID=1761906 RepID=UPI0008D189BC|nr:ketoacyl-ACP synthase III [Streptomyces sp. yr375]SER61081.1 3-oxoacyl-[acyl-carrier-protein] synthase-3 [Streptomyces sp. yr375]
MPKWELAPVSPRSVALALPERVVTNAELCETLDTTPEWIEEKTGILQRRFLQSHETVLDLAVESARKAMAAAEIGARDIDVLVVACTSPDWIMPSLGVSLAERLGIETPRILDLTQHACASSAYGMYTASCLLQEPGLDTALVVCAERGSGITDPQDRLTRIFFGDAAGAVVLRRTDGADGLLSYDLGNVYSDGVRMASAWRVDQEVPTSPTDTPRSPYIFMDGNVVLREAMTRVPKSLSEALSLAGVTVDEVSGFAVHQANAKLVRHIGRIAGAEPERVPVTADTLGNTAAASPLTALWRLAAEGRARRGDVIVLGAIGAGFLYGSLVFRLPADLVAAEVPGMALPGAG